MADTKDIEPKEWRANPEITSENKPQTIISNLLHMQSCLSTYVSIEDMEEIMHAKEAFDSGQIDIDELLVVIQDARQNAEERQGMRNRSREDLQQTLSRIFATTESWPLPLRTEIRRKCESDQSWLDSICDKAASGQTAEEITTRIKKEEENIQGRIKNLNDYLEFVVENAKLPEDPTVIPHFHVHWKTPTDPDWISKVKPIEFYDTHRLVLGGYYRHTPKCEKLDCPSHGKPHSHVIDGHEYDVSERSYILLCHNANCEFKHTHPRLTSDAWYFDTSCDQGCDCMKHNKRPNFMPREADVFERPILA